MKNIVVLLSGLMLGAPALAQESPEAIPEDINADKVLAKPENVHGGWKYKLSLGLTGAWTHNSKVVGAVDGSSFQIGLIMDSSAHYMNGPHEWENTLSLNESQTKTPQIDAFVKSSDDLNLQSTYLYHFESLPWVGPYGRFRLNTQILTGYDIRPGEVNVTRVFADGTARGPSAKPAQKKLTLTSPFEPLLLKESAGVFANPVTEEKINLKTKAGLGFQHIVVQDGFALTGDDGAGNLTFSELQGSTQGGAEVEAEVNGQLSKDIAWGALASAFFPFWTSLDTPLSGADLISLEFGAKLSVRLAEWVSLDYVLSAKRVPLILDEWQIQNGVLLTAGFDFIK